VLKGNSGITKNKEFCPKLWTEKFRHDTSTLALNILYTRVSDHSSDAEVLENEARSFIDRAAGLSELPGR